MTYTDYICQEKKDKEAVPALKLQSMNRYDDSKSA